MTYHSEKWLERALQQYFDSTYKHTSPKNAYILEIRKIKNDQVLVVVSDKYHFITAYIKLTPYCSNLKGTLINIKECSIRHINKEFVLIITDYVVIGGPSELSAQPTCLNFLYQEEANSSLYDISYSCLVTDTPVQTVAENDAHNTAEIGSSLDDYNFSSTHFDDTCGNSSSVFTNSILISTNDNYMDYFDKDNHKSAQNGRCIDCERNTDVFSENSDVSSNNYEEQGSTKNTEVFTSCLTHVPVLANKQNQCKAISFDIDLMMFNEMGKNVYINYTFVNKDYMLLVYYKLYQNWSKDIGCSYEKYLLHQIAREALEQDNDKSSIFSPTLACMIRCKYQIQNSSYVDVPQYISSSKMSHIDKDFVFVSQKTLADCPYVYDRAISNVPCVNPGKQLDRYKYIVLALRERLVVQYRLPRYVYDFERLRYERHMTSISDIFKSKTAFDYTTRNKNRFFYVKNTFRVRNYEFDDLDTSCADSTHDSVITADSFAGANIKRRQNEKNSHINRKAQNTKKEVVLPHSVKCLSNTSNKLLLPITNDRQIPPHIKEKKEDDQNKIESIMFDTQFDLFKYL